MRKLTTIAAAKKDVLELSEFIKLAEEYPEGTLEERILKIYAYCGTLKETVKIINEEQMKCSLPGINESYVRNLIQSSPMNPLHKILRASYMLKTRSQRNRY